MMKTFDPAELTQSERYKLLIGAVTPRPIAFVSTISASGKTNLAPYSFFTAVGSAPMSLLFCPASTDHGDKDTLRNCRPPEDGGTGEFVVNVAVEGYARAMAATAEQLPYGESEFAACGFTEASCGRVSAPRVLESPIAFECRTTHIISLNPGEPRSPNVVIGEVVWTWVEGSLLDERMRIDPERLATIGRMGGTSYCRTTERFDLVASLAGLSQPSPLVADTGPGGRGDTR